MQELVKDDYFFVDSMDPNLVARKIVEIKKQYDDVNLRLNKINIFLRDYLDNQKNINKLKLIYNRLENLK